MSQADTLRLSDTTGIVTPVKPTTPEAVAERKRMALYGYAEGKKTARIAKDIGVYRQTLYQWERDDPAYREQKERVLAERDAFLAEDLEETAFEMAKGNPAVTRDGKPYWPALAKSLSVTNPRRWGEKKEITHSGAVVHTLIPSATRLGELSEGDIIDVTTEEEE